MDEISKKIFATVVRDKYLLSRALAEGLTKELFETTEERTLFDYISTRFSKNNVYPDIEVLRQVLKEDGLLSSKMNSAINEIEKEEPLNLENLLTFIDMLKRKVSEKTLLNISKKIETYVESKTKKEDIVEFTGSIISDLREIITEKSKRKILPVRSFLIRFNAELESRTSSLNPILGYSIEPFSCLNETLSGARQGFYYALAGAPRRGKRI